MTEEKKTLPHAVEALVKTMNDQYPLSEGHLHTVIQTALAPFDSKARSRILDGVRKKLDENATASRESLAAKKQLYEAYTTCVAWLEDIIARGPVLEPNQASRLHKLFEVGTASNLASLDNKDQQVPGSAFKDFNHAFVVKHDWAAALSNAEGFEGDLKFPYELCAFEFRINGRSVTALAWDTDSAIEPLGRRIGYTLCIECDGLWFGYGGDDNDPGDPLLVFVWAQIRAICIALDAEVAVHEVVRAPVALNAKRARTGKPPILDHHIIDLGRRHRISNPSKGTGEPGKKRLHFRRGHWRHYEEHKTWIKWQLIGNPDLGFIQSRYSL